MHYETVVTGLTEHRTDGRTDVPTLLHSRFLAKGVIIRIGAIRLGFVCFVCFVGAISYISRRAEEANETAMENGCGEPTDTNAIQLDPDPQALQAR